MIEFWRYSSRNRVGHEAHPLTLARRELVLELWATGCTKDQIAFAVDIDLDTVTRHLAAGRRAGDARALIRHVGTLKRLAVVT